MSSSRLLTAGSIIAVIAAVTLGIGAWFYYQQAAEVKARNAELQQTKQALDQTTIQAREQQQALNNAIKNSEQHQQQQTARSRRVGVLANGLNAANSVKIAIAESYMAYLKWPTSNKEAGVPEPIEYKAEGITGITDQPNGKIR